MDTTITSALIAALVSSMVALIAYAQARRELKQEREILERQLQRNLTEKLYELRLASYPKAFELTDSLRSELLFSGQLQAKDITSTRNDLIAWANQNSFYMSEQAIQAYYYLRRSLKLKDINKLSKAEAGKIFEAKKRFRGILRADINLLYIEEQEAEQEG